ncbi:hypothetical protein ABEG18_14535 [Alsobacter sp. KACC 23698]|uniref:Uncharacterized protein n=2 Tax=Alsobacter sp. KACC 23698 TaxID=3149229 RepID=A0AAU7JND3_9HYPH
MGLSLALSVLGSVLILPATTTEAGAVTCARGYYRAGCVGPRGAVVARRPPVRAVRVRRY